MSTPAVPPSGTPVTNASPTTATVVVSGGTGVAVTIDEAEGVSVGSGDGTYTVPPGRAVTLTYAAPPTWAWTFR